MYIDKLLDSFVLLFLFFIIKVIIIFLEDLVMFDYKRRIEDFKLFKNFIVYIVIYNVFCIFFFNCY